MTELKFNFVKHCTKLACHLAKAKLHPCTHANTHAQSFHSSGIHLEIDQVMAAKDIWLQLQMSSSSHGYVKPLCTVNLLLYTGRERWFLGEWFGRASSVQLSLSSYVVGEEYWRGHHELYSASLSKHIHLKELNTFTKNVPLQLEIHLDRIENHVQSFPQSLYIHRFCQFSLRILDCACMNLFF